MGRRRIAAIVVGAWLLGLAALRDSAPAPTSPVAAACGGVRSLDASLFLIGDAGAPVPDGPEPDGTQTSAPGRVLPEPVLAALAAAGAERVARLGAERVAIAFLGDNVYPDGLLGEDDPARAGGERRLRAQLEVVAAAGARGFFVPGNHDWGDGADDGWERVRRQTRFVAASGVAGAAAVPADGCPGPVRAALGAHLDLLFLDTHWWLHDGPKPQAPASGCAPATAVEVTSALAAALRDGAGRHAVVMAHHPLASGGPHGGRFEWREHLFPLRGIDRRLWIPLPVIGSAYPLARHFGVSPQDLTSRRYRALIDSLAEALSVAPPLVFAAGHEHGLQVLRSRSARFLLVSGGGSSRNLTWVYPVEGTLHASAVSGYARLDAFADGRVELALVETPRRAPPRTVFSGCLTGD